MFHNIHVNVNKLELQVLNNSDNSTVILTINQWARNRIVLAHMHMTRTLVLDGGYITVQSLLADRLIELGGSDFHEREVRFINKLLTQKTAGWLRATQLFCGL